MTLSIGCVGRSQVEVSGNDFSKERHFGDPLLWDKSPSNLVV